MPFLWHIDGGQDRPKRLFEYPLAQTPSIFTRVSPDPTESVTGRRLRMGQISHQTTSSSSRRHRKTDDLSPASGLAIAFPCRKAKQMSPYGNVGKQPENSDIRVLFLGY
jgi:hypothetical protein